MGKAWAFLAFIVFVCMKCDTAAGGSCYTSDWTSWGACNASCESTGSMSRTRTGVGCTVNTVETDTQACTEDMPCTVSIVCPANCTVAEWSDWSNCSFVTGVQTNTRTRNKTKEEVGGGTCPYELTENRTCVVTECTSNCTVTQWAEWANCTWTTSISNSTRTRAIDAPAGGNGTCPYELVDYRLCLEPVCSANCTVSDWSGWSNCTFTAPIETSTRNRSIVDAPTGNGTCPYAMTQNRTCFTTECSSNCTVNEWSEWGNCAFSGGVESSIRTRTVNETQTGNGTCPFPMQDSRACLTTGCLITTTAPMTTTASTAELFAWLESLGIDPATLSDSMVMSSAVADLVPFFISELPESERMKLYATLDETSKKCMYNGQPCDRDAIRTAPNPFYGVCHTYNFDDSAGAELSYGSNRGLTWILAGNPKEITCNSASTGYVVQIHSPDEAPLPETAGHYVAPGYRSSFGMSKTTVTRLNTPKSPCISDNPNPAKYFYNGSYVPELCHRSCFQTYVTSQCGCADPRYSKHPSVEYCKFDKKLCLDAIVNCESDITQSANCDCPDACNYDIYQTYTTISQLEVEKNSTDIAPSDSVVYIYFAQGFSVSFSEKPQWTIVSLLYDISNMPGLTSGFCIMTLFELLVVAGQMIFYGLQCKVQ